MIRKLYTVIIGGILLAMSLSSSVVNADSQTSVTGSNGLQVSPVRTELTMVPGQSKTVLIYITDESSMPATLQAIVNDFTSQGEGGTPSLILNGQSITHGLKQFIGAINNVTVEPQQTVTVPVEISIPKNTLGGGYYAAVRFESASNTASSQNVTLSASVASLILAQVNGSGISQKLNLSGFSVSHGSDSGRFFIGSHGLSAVVRFYNSGNVQEAPYGKVVVRLGSKTIMTKEINNASYPSSVLPGSAREFSVPLNALGSIGKYTVSGYFGYDNSSQLLSTTTNIYVVSTWAAVVIGTIVVLMIASIIWLVMLFKKRLWPTKPTYSA